MGYIVITYKIPTNRKLKVGYRTAGSSQPYSYLSRYLESFETPYYINVPDGSYQVELSSIRENTQFGDKICGKSQYYFTDSTGDSLQPINASFRVGVEKNFSDTAGLLFYEFKSDTELPQSIQIKGTTLYTYYPNDPTPFTTSHTFTVNIPSGVKDYKVRPTFSGVSVNTKIVYTCYNIITPPYINNKQINISNIAVCGTLPRYDSGPTDLGAQTIYSPIPGYSE